MRYDPPMEDDIAQRVYNHAWKLDPIVRSLLDTDFYKLLMLQMIWARYPDVRATFSLLNRTKRIRLADTIDERALRDQLDQSETIQPQLRQRLVVTHRRHVGDAGNRLRHRITFDGRRLSARVLDVDHRVTADGRPGRDADDALGRREFDRIVQQIGDALTQDGGVALHWDGLCGLHGQLLVLLLGQHTETFRNAGDELA